MGFILFSSIFACSAVMLNGSTVYGRHPVSMAYMLTPLRGEEEGSMTQSVHNLLLSLPHSFRSRLKFT